MRAQHLPQRALAMNIENKVSNSSTIVNIQKIEQVILMWNKINYLTSNKIKASIQTIDIPVDENINWNDIKQLNLQFKTIDDPEITEQVIVDRNSNNLNQARCTQLTIEPLLSLIGTDSFTSFSQELLNEKADIKSLKMSPVP